MTDKPKGTTRRKAGAAKAAKSEEKGPRIATLTKLGDHEFETPIEVPLPENLPATYSIDLAAMMGKFESGQPSIGSLYNFLVSLIGEEQLARIRQRLAEEEVSADAVGGPTLLLELTNLVGEAWGTELGESSASAEPSSNGGTN